MEREFKQAVEQHFRFLRDDFRFKHGVEKDRDDLTLWYADRRVRVNVILEGAWAQSEDSRAIRVMVVPLEGGKVPDQVDAGLHLRQTSFDLEDLVPLYDPAWSTPPARADVRSATDAEGVVAAYGAALRKYGKPALTGDAGVFQRLADARRRRLIGRYTEMWSTFVEQVCLGFEGSISEYVDGINVRDQLQTFLQRWSGGRAEDPVDRLQGLDDRFLACTEPMPFRFTEKWQVVPTPSGDLFEPLQRGILVPERLVDLGHLLRGDHPGRRNPEDITVFKNCAFVSVADLAISALLIERATAAGRGTVLDT